MKTSAISCSAPSVSLLQRRGTLAEKAYSHTRLTFLQIVFVLTLAMPVRLQFSIGALNTLSILDFAIWALALVYLLRSLLSKAYIGNKTLLILLFVPLFASILSLLWSMDVLSTVKNSVYILTAIAGYWVTVNLFHNSSPKAIANAIALLIVASIAVALLYWSRIPLVWAIFRFPVEQTSGLDSYSLAARFARLDHPYLGRSNDFATTLALFSTLLLGIALISKSSKYLLITSVGLVGILMTLSRGVMVSMLIVLGPAIYLRWPSRKVLAMTGILILGLIPVFFFVQSITNSGIDILDSRLNDLSNVAARFERFGVAWNMIAAAPLLGLGGGRFIGVSVNDVSSAVHNTFLEQWASYGLILGTIVSASFLATPLIFFRWQSTHLIVKKVAKFAGLAVLTYLLVCTNQTSNEAVMPRLLYHVFLAVAVAFLSGLEQAMHSEPAEAGKKQ